MSDQKAVIDSILDQLASQVVVLEPGDLMSYGEILSSLEQLAVVADGATEPCLTDLASSLKELMEGMILGEVPDQDKGVSTITAGVSLGQAFLRNDAGKEDVHVFLAEKGIAKEAEPQDQAQVSDEAAPEKPAEQAEEPPAPTPEPEAPEGPPAAAGVADEVYAAEDLELLEGFVTEALEHLESIEINALVLEDTPEDQETLNAVFRPFHTIKGVSGFLNLGDINKLAHALENVLDQARSGALIIESAAIDLILAGVDMLRQMITEAQDAALAKRPRTLFDISSLLKRVEDLLSGGEATQEAPGKPLGEILVETGIVEKNAVDQALETQKNPPHRPLGELLVKQGAVQPSQVARAISTQKTQATTLKPTAQSVKIDTAKLDNLLDMVGELVISQSMVQANPNIQKLKDRKLSRDLSQLGRITSELQKSTMSMRMVPIKQTFQKMVRVVRDTSQKAQKKIELKLQGESTEIDRNMVEKFYDPLMHMVRNSVDHGIETPDERLKAGKPETGTVILSAYHQGGNVCVEIKDDGRGLDREKILAKALENGIITEADGLNDEEVFKLIFQPGFSTAQVVTEISGRGVGMDVVQKTIDELRGKVNIVSEPGEGTTFTIALPLTLAIIDGMVVEVGQERYILPTISVAESLRPKKEEYSTVQGRGEMIMIRGSLIPLIRLYEVVQVDPEKREPWEALVVVIEHHGQQRCLLVDRLVGRQEVVIKSLGHSLKKVKVLAGGAIMGDGRVGLILDVEGIFKHQDK